MTIDEDAARPKKRVVVLYERGRSGAAALAVASRLVEGDGSALTVLTYAPQDTRTSCGAGSAIDYNRAVCVAADAELREARELLGPVGQGAMLKLLVEDKDPPVAAWIASGDFDVVLLPARRRPLRRAKHPVADRLRTSTSAAVRIVNAASSLEELGTAVSAGLAHRRGATSGATDDGTAGPHTTGTAAPGA